MKKLFVLLTLTLVLKNATGQCDSLFFRNAATFIYDLVLIDSSKIIGVGDNGYIIKSTDGGKSWKNIPTFQPYFLRSVFAATDSVLYAVGSWKTILKSEDQGETWYPLMVKVTGFTSASVFLNDVFFLNKDKGFIVGDESRLITTTDGGRTWKDTTFSMTSSSRINAVTFVNDTLGFICGGSNAMFRTKNGGATWEAINLSFLGFNRELKKVKFLDPLNGFAVGDNGIFIKTTDGGTTWTLRNTPTGSGAIYFDVFFLDPQSGFIAGIYTGGIILKTNDGGNTWNILQNNFGSCYSMATDAAKTKIAFAGGGSAGDFLGYNGRSILTTIDAGATFQLQSANSRVAYNDIFFLNDSTGYITGDGGQTFKTTDYGESWKPLQYIPAFSANPAKNIFFINEQYGYGASDRIYRTSNGGNSWDLVNTPDGQIQFFPRRMHFFDSEKGLVLNNIAIYKTMNSGATWSQVLNPTPNPLLSDFCFTPNGKGYAVGYDGKVFVSPDQGDTWNSFNLNTSSYLTSVYFFNNNLGFIGSADSILYKTVDGGNNWTLINVRPGAMIRSLFFLNDTMGYMLRNNIGGIGGIYKTKNGGASWFGVNGVSEGIARLTGANNVYAAGGSGFIFKTDRSRRPGIPGYIYGTGINCKNAPSYFTTGLLQGVNYTWSLSGGGTTMFNQNIDTVIWNAAGTYNLSVTISNLCGTGPTRQIPLTVYEPTSITTQPVSQQACIGALVTFTVTANGGSITYQWKKAGAVIPGATNNAYTISSITAGDAANYSVDVSGRCGSITSSNASLTILPPNSCVTAVSPIDNPISVALLMPNIVRDNTTLKIVVRKNVKIKWVVLDANGRSVMQFTNQPVHGENYYSLSFQHLSSGIYFIRGSIENDPVQFIKFVKL